MERRKILIGAASLAAIALIGRGGRAAAELPDKVVETPVFDDDRVLGEATAPITIIEYSSLTCPHCAAFHTNALPGIRENWIAKGRVRLVYRHFPLDGLALRAAAVANCIPGERYFAFLDVLFQNQDRWTRASDPLKALAQFAALAGLSKSRFDACINDQAEMERIIRRAQEGGRAFDVQATPTLIINGRKFEGARAYKDYDEIFRALDAES